MNTSKELKLKLVSEAYESRPRRDESKEIVDGANVQYFIKDSVPENVHAFLSETARSLDIHSLDLTHEIMNAACSKIADCSLQTLRDAENGELSENAASVYTDVRLSYINHWNQDEVSEIVRDYGCDIATAAATWYERQVAEAIEALKGYILND